MAASVDGLVEVEGIQTPTDAHEAFRFPDPKLGGETFDKKSLRVAVLLPCFNEELTVAKTVQAFKAALPEAEIYVGDNRSTDSTRLSALEAGARVIVETRRGKGHVVRRLFADVDADYYVIADGDDTYDAAIAGHLLARATKDRLDMVVASRAPTNDPEAFRYGHRFGNRMITAFIGWMFGKEFDDILSGYRVLSRRFVKSFPALSNGFEIETELSVHALRLAMPVSEYPTSYRARAEGSVSKLSTVRDGFRIGSIIVLLIKEERPLLFFGTCSAVLLLAAGVLGFPVLLEYQLTGLVPRLPTALLAASIVVLAALSLTCGLILDSMSRARREMKRLQYLLIEALAKR